MSAITTEMEMGYFDMRYRLRSEFAVLGLAGLAVMSLVGCSNSTSSAGQAGGGTTGNAALFSSPVSAIQQLEISNASDQLIKSCMGKHGFQYPTQPMTLSEFITNSGSTDPLYADTQSLRSNGYGIYGTVLAHPARTPNVSSDPNVTYLHSLPAAQQQEDWKDLFGGKSVTITQPDGTTEQDGATGGCYGAAKVKLYDSATSYDALSVYTANLLSDVATRATWSAPWKAVQAKWITCMTAAGYKYKDRDAAEADISNRYSVKGVSMPAVHQYELSVAKQDATCVDEFGMNTVAAQQMSVAAGSMTTLETGALLDWNQMERRAAAAATEVLANG